jgi:hypothetical protein
MNKLDKYDKVFTKAFSIDKLELIKLKYQSISQKESVGQITLTGSLKDTSKIGVKIDNIIDFRSFGKSKKFLKKYKITI